MTQDPINIEIRELLFAVHLAHARKQLSQGKYGLARKELEEARPWARKRDADLHMVLIAGLVELGAGVTETARARLQEGAELAGGGLAGHLALVWEASRGHFDLGKVLRAAKLPKLPRKIATDDAMACFRAIHNANRVSDKHGAWPTKTVLEQLGQLTAMLE